MEEVKVKVEDLGFDDAISLPDFVKFESEKQRNLVLENVRFERLPLDDKFNGGEVALFADVIEDNGVKCGTTLKVTSNRLLEALKPIFTGNMGGVHKLRVLKHGEGYNSTYEAALAEKGLE
jgi:hypothetical protein